MFNLHFSRRHLTMTTKSARHLLLITYATELNYLLYLPLPSTLVTTTLRSHLDHQLIQLQNQLHGRTQPRQQSCTPTSDLTAHFNLKPTTNLFFVQLTLEQWPCLKVQVTFMTLSRCVLITLKTTMKVIDYILFLVHYHVAVHSLCL